MSQNDLVKVLQLRAEVVDTLNGVGKEMKRLEDDLADIDFKIDCQLDNDLRPMGLRCLDPFEKKYKFWGKDLDQNAFFPSKHTWELGLAKGKSLCDGKITQLVQRLLYVNSRVQQTKNYRVVAFLNNLLSMLLVESITLDKVAKTDCIQPYPKIIPPKVIPEVPTRPGSPRPGTSTAADGIFPKGKGLGKSSKK
jgi:hypothetical protein